MRTSSGEPLAWYRIPVFWVAAFAVLLLLAACVTNIVVALQLSDTALAEVAPSARFGFSVDEGAE